MKRSKRSSLSKRYIHGHFRRFTSKKPCKACGNAPAICRSLCRTCYTRWYRSTPTGKDGVIRYRRKKGIPERPPPSPSFCERCMDANYLLECKCGCGTIIPRRSSRLDKVRRKRYVYYDIREYAIGHGTITPEAIQKIRLTKLADKNPNWKGDDAGYSTIQEWVGRNLPKPTACQICGRSPPHDAENISGKYLRDLSDWRWLCRRCHMLSDGRMNNLSDRRMFIRELEEAQTEWYIGQVERLLQPDSNTIIRKKNKPLEKRMGKFVYIYKPDHSSAFGGYVPRARLMMEEHLGRPLKKEERVTHINEIADDDRLENLLLFSSTKELSDYNNCRRRKPLLLEKRMQGFVYILKPEHPHTLNGGYVKRSRLVMEEHLGRLLKKGELVAHINGKNDDDRLENLLLFPNENEYSKYFYQNHREEYAEWNDAWRKKHQDRVRQMALESYYRRKKLTS
jgi:uncharacterized protein (DUF1330 family)